MRQSLFEVVKQSVTTKAAAEHYGIEVKRGGMAKCPFHSDQSPSLKLNDGYYYCFGCGATGDVIDLVARLFQIGNKEAAERIAADFGLQYDSQVPCVPPKRTATAVQIAKQRERYTYGVLTRYHSQLQEWLAKYAPKNPDWDIDPRYVEAIHRKDYVEYLMDTILTGSPEEKAALCAERNPDIRRIVHRLTQLANENNWFVDFVGTYFWHEQEIKSYTPAQDVVRGKYDTNSWQMATYLGKRIELENNWFLEPTAGLSYMHVEGLEYRTNYNTYVKASGAGFLSGSAGLYGGKEIIFDNGMILNAYGRTNLIYDWDGKSKVQVSDYVFEEDIASLRYEFGAGVNAKFDEQSSAYFEATTQLGDQVDIPWEFNVGYRYAF